MTDRATDDAAAVFDPMRPRLTRIAYRMLGSVADAEDVVQEAFLRWHAADRATVREPEAFLRQVVTRLCLDVLKSARRNREVYVGPWLPEPVFTPDEAEVDDVTLPLMLALERLSPLERAAFLLHDVFGVDFDEVSETIGRDPAACRQLASRARTHVRSQRPRFAIAPEHGMEIAHAFFAASREGDLGKLRALLSDDVLLHSDGGGKRPAALRILTGIEDVMKVQTVLARIFAEHPSQLLRYGRINGLPGFITMEPDGQIQTTALAIEDGHITAIYVMRNPDKLRHLDSVH
jgi:RNA polymerase sigma-70 factor (ECF subfamily)